MLVHVVASDLEKSFPSMPNKLSRFVTFTVLFAVLFAGLFFLGGFSANQSIALAFLFCTVWLWVFWVNQEKLPFVPYCVFISSKLNTIATDFELVKAPDEEWAMLWDGIDKPSKEQRKIWNSSFSFSVITPQLTFQHPENSFTTKLKLSASIEPVGTLREAQQLEEDDLFRPSTPRLELDSWGNGYRIRLVLIESHWNKIKSKPIFAKMDTLDVNFDRMCGIVEVLLAVIPEEEFRVHFRVYPGGSLKPYEEAIKGRVGARARYGWKGKSHTDMYDRETTADRSNIAEHKYFSISHSSI